MRNVLYIVALIFMTIWAISFFFFMAGAIIHLLLIAAIIAICIKIYKIRENKSERLKNTNLNKR